MKKLIFCLLFLSGVAAQGQAYYNEWIDYSKTYYKFKVGKTGLYRIPQATLAAAGLAAAPAEQFQLWRNGVQVPLYTSQQAGTLAPSDYIEFWGEMNDGKPDRLLYRDPDYQLNDKWSLETDSATYFLTVNGSGANLRLRPAANNIAGNTLPAEPYFMHTAGNYFKNRINRGYAVYVGELLFSSSYDMGEGWVSDEILMGNANSFTFPSLFVYPGGPNPTFRIGLSGNAIHLRNYRVQVNGDSIWSNSVNYFTYTRDSVQFPLTLLASNSATVRVTNVCNEAVCPPDDKMVIHQYELTYPRQFNFGGATNFEFTLPASAAGNYLEISGFTYGTAAPVLYDLTNGQRYVANTAAAPLVKVVLPPSATERRLVLVNEETARITFINGMQQRNFINFGLPANQANYLIITNPRLLTSAGANPVEEYRAYRSSAVGGGFDAKLYMVDELTDQFGYGINKHPIALKNFLLYARQNFTVPPGHVFLIGRGVNYVEQNSNQFNPDIDKINLVPPYGWPASDILFTANQGSSQPEIPIGRLSVVNPQEVAIYLKKVKETELAQQTLAPDRKDREWMKNVVHLNGISEPALKPIVNGYFDNYKRIIGDTSFGGRVTVFSKSTADAVQQISASYLQTLFREGVSLMTYFGHSSTTTLEFNLENPESYQNQGKYPMFFALGCNAGDFFKFSPRRLSEKETISEKYILAQDRGTIGFVASTHFGIVHYLDIWNAKAYKALSVTHYGASIGEIMKVTAADVFTRDGQHNEEDFYARANVEETELHGDPAIRINPHAKPDYVVDDPSIRIAPDFISIAEPFVQLHCRFYNIGKAVSRKSVLQVRRQYPNGTSEVVYRYNIEGIRYADSIDITLPIDAMRDKGLNKITVTLDADGEVDELYETNNSVTKEFVVFEDELRPSYPQNYAIVSQQGIKLAASTANAFSASKEYRMELDTTALFNSPLKVTQSVTTIGGVIEFDPGVRFTDSTVYYWRVAQVSPTGRLNWNVASFIYLPQHEPGFNQSHLYQQLRSEYSRVSLDSVSRRLRFGNRMNNLFVKNGVFGTATGQEGDLIVNVNTESYIRSVCNFGIIFNVFDKLTFKPWKNTPEGGGGRYNSLSSFCAASRNWNFEFSNDSAGRRKAFEFLRQIPDGSYVVIRNIPSSSVGGNQYVDTWIADEQRYGAGNTLYNELKRQGLSAIDSFTKPRVFAGVFKKNSAEFQTVQALSAGIFDIITLSADCATSDSVGFIHSPLIGPAKTWKNLIWDGYSTDAGPGDYPRIDIIGVQKDGDPDTLYQALSTGQRNFDLGSINAERYPYLQLKMRMGDTVFYTPYQLKHWRITYEHAPEGALAPNLYMQLKDTLEVGEPLDLKLAFKNITETAFDSLKVKMVLTDVNNVQHVLPVQVHRPLNGRDTLHIRHYINTKQFAGRNSLFLEVNPDGHQLEQYHFNNFAFREFYVRYDTLNPLLDVTFDNVHILNFDIVSARPDILIKLQDEAKWNLLDDTALVKVQVRHLGSGALRTYYFNSDTLRFTPAGQAPNDNNTATISFKPYFEEDGKYELVITGTDGAGNGAGDAEYRVSFMVINKAQISNMLNYPNPFTTSTAFVFTLTGSEVPQELKIQILTVTGKVVREITRAELGTLRIGRNITDFKWDGTDQFGQKLANGVYLYRVVTSLNGKTLEKYKTKDTDTDQYFNKGYGKMYLMR